MNEVKRNFIYNTLYQLLVILIPIITTPYLSRTLGSEGIGVYSYNYSIANYFVLFIMLGLNNYGNREIAKVKDDKNKLAETFWNIYSMQFVLGVIFIFIYILFCFFIADSYFYSILMLPYVISGMLDINWFFFGLEKFKLTVIRNVIVKISTTILIFSFVRSSEDVWKYCIVMTGGMLLSQLLVWPRLFKEIVIVIPKWKKIKSHIKPNLMLFLTVIAVSLFKIMDKIMLGIITTTTQVGFYEAAEKIIAIPIALISSLGTVMLPRMSNLVANNNEDIELLRKSLIFAMFFSSSMCFGIMAVSREFVPLFYGKGFETCIYLYLVLLPSCLFLAFANVIRSQYLLPHQLDKPYVISAFLGAGINLIINFLLIPLFESIGAAVGTLCAEAVVCIYQSYAVNKYISLTGYIKEVVPFVFAGMGMFLILYPMQLDFGTLLNLILKVILGVVIYFTILSVELVLFSKGRRKIYFKMLKNVIKKR